MNQVNEYMRHKKLPMQMQKKLVTFYEYKYKKRYFREIGITDALSGKIYSRSRFRKSGGIGAYQICVGNMIFK